jgi:hypothetical protein
MSNIFKKLIKFFCATACAIAFSLPLYALDVESWAAPYMYSNTFDLNLWVNGGFSHKDGSILSDHTATGIPSEFTSKMAIYSLGAKADGYSESANINHNTFLSDLNVQTTLLSFSGLYSPASQNPVILNSDPITFSVNELLTTSITTGPPPPDPGPVPPVNEPPPQEHVTVTVDAKVNSDGLFHATSASSSPPTYFVDVPDILDPDFFRFYDLNNSIDQLPGYWLGAIAIQFTFDQSQNGSLAYSFSPAWGSLGVDGAHYEDMVFLFGTVSEPPVAVPEPHVYLVLGTLLGILALVARRKTQVA